MSQANQLGESPLKALGLTPANLSAVAAAQYAGVSRAKLYGLWKDGAGPPRHKIGSRTLVSVKGLQQWLDEQQSPQLQAAAASRSSRATPSPK